MKRRIIKALITCLIISITFTGGYYGYNKFFINKAAATTNDYKAVAAKKMDMQVGIQGTGSVYAAVSKDITANNSGILKDLNVKVGDTVTEGQKLFVSDSDNLRQSVSDAQTNLDKQKLTLANDTNSYNDSIAKANSAIAGVKTALNNAKDELNKMSVTSPASGVIVAVNNKNGDSISGNSSGGNGSLYGKANSKGGSNPTVVLIIQDANDPNNKVQVTPNNDGILNNLNLKVGDSVQAGETLFISDSDALKQNVKNAQSNLDKQNSALTAIKNTNKLQMDSLNISDAQTTLNSAQDAVNKMIVTAPMGGLVTAVNNSNDDNVSASGGSAQGSSSATSNTSSQTISKSGQNSGSSGQSTSLNNGQANSTSSSQANGAIMTIVDKDSLKVKVAVDELDIAKIQVGQKAEIRFDAVNGKVYEGKVEAMPQTGTTTNGVTTYDVVVSIDNAAEIKIGMSANVNILVDSKANTLAIPADALIQKDGKKYVMDGNNNLIEVKTGIENENYIEILDGVTDGEKLIESSAQGNSATNMSK